MYDKIHYKLKKKKKESKPIKHDKFLRKKKKKKSDLNMEKFAQYSKHLMLYI